MTNYEAVQDGERVACFDVQYPSSWRMTGINLYRQHDGTTYVLPPVLLSGWDDRCRYYNWMTEFVVPGQPDFEQRILEAVEVFHKQQSESMEMP